MSNRRNHRRGEEYRSEHGPRWENGDPGHGCNSTHVARSRSKFKQRLNRLFRREAKNDLDSTPRRKRWL